MRKVQFWGTFKMMNTLLKKSIFLFLLFLLFNVTGFSQSTYSKQNLEQATLEELNAYLKASAKKKRTGTMMSVVGPLTLFAGGIVFNESYENNNYTTTDMGGYMILAGLVTTLTGVPILVTGSSRVKKITRIMDAKTASFKLGPYSFHNTLAHNTHPGITLKVKF